MIGWFALPLFNSAFIGCETFLYMFSCDFTCCLRYTDFEPILHVTFVSWIRNVRAVGSAVASLSVTIE